MVEEGNSGSRWGPGGIWLLLILATILAGGFFGLRSGADDATLEQEIIDRLGSGAESLEVEVSWGRVSLSGVATSDKMRDQALRVAAATDGVSRVSDRMRVVPPQLRSPQLTLVRMEDGRFSLEGILTAEDRESWRSGIAEIAEIAYAHLRESSGVTSMGMPESLAAALQGLPPAVGLEISLIPGRLSLAGELPDEASRMQIVAALEESLPDGWQVLDGTSIRPPMPAVADEAESFAKLLEGLAIDFEPGTFQLTPASELALARIEGFLHGQTGLRVEIAAADDPARPGTGKRRADAIYMALMQRGVSSISLTSRSLGDEAPETGVARFRLYPR